MTATPSSSPLDELEYEIRFTRTLLGSLEGDTSEDAGLRRLDLEMSLNDLNNRLEHKKKQSASREDAIGALGQSGDPTNMDQSSSHVQNSAGRESSSSGFGSYATHGDGSFGGTQDVDGWDDSWTFGYLEDSNLPTSAVHEPRGTQLSGETSSADTSPAANSALSSPSLPDLPLGKRARESFASAPVSGGGHQRKYRRTTPSPALTGPTTPSSLDSLGIPEEDLELAKTIMGDLSTRTMRDRAKEAEQRAQQEREDAEFARMLQEGTSNTHLSPSQYSAPSHKPLPKIYSQAGPSSAFPVKSEQFSSGLDDGIFHFQQMPPSTPAGLQSNPSVAPTPKQLPTRPYIDLGSDDDLFEIQPEAFQDNGRLNRRQPEKSTGSSHANAVASNSNSTQDIDDILAQYDKVQNIQHPWTESTDENSSANWFTDTSLPDPNINAQNTSLWGSNPVQSLRQGAMGFGQSFKDTANAWYNGVVGANSTQSAAASPFVDSNYWGSSLPVFDQGLYVGPSGSTNPEPLLNQFGLPQPKSLESIIQDSSFNVNGLEGHDLYQNYRDRYDYIANDPTKTKDELTSLLENIRPDEELPPENREGTPERMTYPLMEHQKLGLTWLKNMEEGSNKGGILADDMGLGKTIQALSLIVSRPSTDPQRKTTLIIGPVALMKQWEREIQTKVKGGRHALTVYTLHGAKKGTWSVLRNFDVVLTTYGTLASEFNRREAWEMKKRGDPNLQPGPADRLSLLADECKWYR